MSEKILVPALGESITEATVSKWLKKVGDPVEADEAIVELETDKVNLEVPSPLSGILSEIKSKDGDTVEVGAVLGSVSEGKSNVEKKAPSKEEKEVETVPEDLIKEENTNVINLEIEKKPNPKSGKISATSKEEPMELLDEVNEEPLLLTDEVQTTQTTKVNPIVLSPAVRKIAAENNIDMEKVKGTGRDGRVLKGDLLSLMGTNPQPSQRRIQYGEEERIKMTRLRQTIAKRLKQAQENAAMLTTFNEVDMSSIMSMRKDNQEDFKNRYGIKLGLMSFFVTVSYTHLRAHET